LTLFSYEILGLVGRDGAGPHDLLLLARRGRFFNWAGESQYYTEPKRLAKLGYLSSRREPGKTRERTVYTLTDKGLEALRERAQTPVAFTRLESERLLRLLSVTWWARTSPERAWPRYGTTSPTSSRGSTRPSSARTSFPIARST
jgi:hypothetical protein